MMLFAGNANPELAEAISSHLNIPLGRVTVGNFSDGETMVEIHENVRGRDVYLIQSTCAPSNQNLMELVIMVDAFRRASAGKITAVMPYFGYARQDRRVRSARVPITAKVAADMLGLVGVTRVVTVDLHAEQIQGFFTMPVDNIYSTKVMLDAIKHDHPETERSDLMVVSPDVGGVVRARAIAKRLNDVDLAIIDKRRSGPNRSEVMHVIGDVKDRHCLITDDIVDTAGTLCSAAVQLKKDGAKTVTAYITHPVLSGPAIKNIESSEIDQLVVADTIPLSEAAKNCSKIRQVSLSALLSQALLRIREEDSVSSMFVD